MCQVNWAKYDNSYLKQAYILLITWYKLSMQSFNFSLSKSCSKQQISKSTISYCLCLLY